MAFAVDQAVLQEVNRLSRLQAVLLASRHDGPWQALASVFDADDTGAIAEQVPRGARQFQVTLGDEHLRGLYTSLLDEGGQRLGVALMQSFDEAVAPYRRLQLTLLALTVLGVIVFAIGSVLTAKRISEPLRALSESARRLGSGDYDSPMPRATDDEVGDLARALEAMRHGIQERDRQVNRLAFWDPLTALPNREQFSQRLHERLRGSRQPCAILMLDLDRFKHVNDVLGHRFGDRLLCSVADKLRTLRSGAHDLARLGGDEFAVLLDDADAAAALDTARRIQRQFEQPVLIDDQIVDLSVSIGIACCPVHGHNADLLLGRAELAMYAAKHQRGSSQIYEPRLDVGSQESLSLLSELRQAVARDELRLFLQPKADLASGVIVGAEALVRWQHPQRGLLPPSEFIPFAEQAGFVRHVSTWMVAAAARAWQAMHAAGCELSISVNLSARDLMDPDLAARFKALVRERGAPPSALCLEITEGAIMEDPQRAQLTLEQLGRLGFRLSIDDFGTGYSSLAYLKRLAVDELKIDKSFVMGMEADLDDAKIVRSTIELAHNLGLSVVAEGLETERTWKLLAALGCDHGQGYYIARPMPEAQFVSWLRDWHVPELVGQDAPASLLAGLD
jgi:diguanylate cyclase (GGDEF)-like protein